MGRYSIRGSAAFDERLDRDFARTARAVSESPHGPAFRALVLIGGYGRGEGTPLIVGNRQEPFNDYDFVVVSEPMTRRRRNHVQAALRQLEQRLTGELGLPVDLCLYTDNALRRAEFSLLNYEMKYGHKVVWGDERILDRMPAYPHTAIPLSEGTRLLLNRGKLLLDIRRALRTGRALTADGRLRFVKFVFKTLLAFGDCALLLHHDYDLSYTTKAERIGRYAASGVPEAAFMVENYRRAITLKEWGDYRFLESYDWVAEYERVRRYYVGFFHWYESRRLGATVTTSADYARALALSPQECPAAKAVALNLRSFGARAGQWGAAMLRAHPRARLYLALPILLGDTPADPALLGRILGSPASDLDEAERRFYDLQKRYS
jgi:hypothetical protein